MRPLLGTILAERGLIDPARLAEALAEAQATGQRVGEVLLRKGWIYEQELARALAHQYGLEYVDLKTAYLTRATRRSSTPSSGSAAAPSRSASRGTSSSSRSPTPRRPSPRSCARGSRICCASSSPSRRSSSRPGTPS
jgi:hypothetical protein